MEAQGKKGENQNGVLEGKGTQTSKKRGKSYHGFVSFTEASTIKQGKSDLKARQGGIRQKKKKGKAFSQRGGGKGCKEKKKEGSRYWICEKKGTFKGKKKKGSMARNNLNLRKKKKKKTPLIRSAGGVGGGGGKV